MKKMITAQITLSIVLMFTATLAHAQKESFAAVVPGWSFIDPNPTNPIFNSSSESFKGTLTKRGDDLISALVVLKEKLPTNVKTQKHLRHWLNANYFEGRAETLYSTAIKGAEDAGQLFIFKEDIKGSLRIVFLYTYTKDKNVVILSQESTPETYKEDMDFTVRALKNIKFI